MKDTWPRYRISPAAPHRLFEPVYRASSGGALRAAIRYGNEFDCGVVVDSRSEDHPEWVCLWTAPYRFEVEAPLLTGRASRYFHSYHEAERYYFGWTDTPCGVRGGGAKAWRRDINLDGTAGEWQELDL